jgi:hypothetical protein
MQKPARAVLRTAANSTVGDACFGLKMGSLGKIGNPIFNQNLTQLTHFERETGIPYSRNSGGSPNRPERILKNLGMMTRLTKAEAVTS